ncbi:MAG: hypothetical protein V4678_00915 [Patescibacteria group bacterium]
MLNERASKRQQELLSFVDGFIKGNGYGPSYREIMRALGYKSVSTVAIHVDNLIAKGYLARRDKSARSLEVVTTRIGAPAPLAASTPEVSDATVTQELIKRVNDAKLEASELVNAVGVFERLNLHTVAEAIRPKESNEAVS